MDLIEIKWQKAGENCIPVINSAIIKLFAKYTDYKWCERLHKFIGKKIVVTRELNARHCKEQLKICLHACVMA
jgi:hypothetical protein